MVDLILKPGILSFLVTALVTPLVIKFAGWLGVIDDPKKRSHPAHLHDKPTPRGGGIPIFAGILVASLFFLPLEQRLVSILLGAAILVFVGFLDDRKDIHPYLRLVAQFLAAGVVVAAGIGIAFVNNPVGPGIIDLSHPRIVFELGGEQRSIWILSALFGFLWIVALTNFVSWSSGVDGQLSGFSGIAASVIALLSLKFSADITQWPVTILASAVAGAFFGFLPYHKFPQKIMPGEGGEKLAGFMLAVLSILSTTKVGTLFVVLALPLLDAFFAITRRVASGRNPIWGDRGHFHHRLLDAGWSKKHVAYFYWAASAFLGMLALNLSAQAKFYTIVGAGLFLGGLILWLSTFGQSSKQPGRSSG